MKAYSRILHIVFGFMLILSACAPDVLPPLTSTPTPPGQMETIVAATIYVNQTSTAAIEQAVAATLAAAVPLPTKTPEVTLTPNASNLNLPASACWINSEVSVRTGQTVVIRAVGVVNTWGGREGSSSDPNGQTGVCGAFQCPLQGAGYGALIGRVDDGKTFLVGTNLEFVPTKDGQLYFTVNDWECEDNSGVFDILITFP